MPSCRPLLRPDADPGECWGRGWLTAIESVKKVLGGAFGRLVFAERVQSAEKDGVSRRSA